MRIRIAVAIVVAAATTAALATLAQAREPRLTVDPSRLAAAMTCYGKVGPHAPAPIVFAPGTGSDASQVWALGSGAFEAIGHPLCAVAFPNHTTADVQMSVQYLVFAIRAVSRRAGRSVTVAGVSQGGLLARVAVTYWPSLRRMVADVVTAAAPHHGAPVPLGLCARLGCPPAIWQQARGSRFLRALNHSRDETPGPTAWTTVRSAADEVVAPETGPRPTAVLAGAENILIQDVCPGRRTTHLGTAVDSVTLAALGDAVAHLGPAAVSRLPADVCSHPYGTGLDEQQTARFLALAPALGGQAMAAVPRVREEPKVRSWARAKRCACAARSAGT